MAFFGFPVSNRMWSLRVCKIKPSGELQGLGKQNIGSALSTWAVFNIRVPFRVLLIRVPYHLGEIQNMGFGAYGCMFGLIDI